MDIDQFAGWLGLSKLFGLRLKRIYRDVLVAIPLNKESIEPSGTQLRRIGRP